VQASYDEMAVEVEENDEVNLETPLKEGSVHSTESLQNTDHVNSQEEVVEIDGIYNLFDVDFACTSGQETAAAVPDSLIDVCFCDHDFCFFSVRDSNNENFFFLFLFFARTCRGHV